MRNFFKWTLSVIILTMLVILAIHFVEGQVDKNVQEDIKTEMLQVQAKSKIVLEKHHVDSNNALIGEKMDDSLIEEKYNITDIANYYKWTKEVLQEQGIKDSVINENDYYLINYETGEVVYSEGYKTEDGNVYYKLSEIKELNIENKQEAGEKQSDGERDSKTE